MTSSEQAQNPVYPFPESYFEMRLKILGFEGLSVVADAACGTGVWTKPLADLNREIVGFDIDIASLNMARSMLKREQRSNAGIIAANLLKQPFAANAVDGVFCFGAVMYANPLQVFREFHRILRRKGLVYASVNAPGWALYCILHRGLKERNFSKVNMGLRMFYDTLARRLLMPECSVVHTFFTQKDLRQVAKAAGFRVLHTGYEGTYKNENFEQYAPCFQARYLGLTCSLEILMEKD
jgi:ubiquinone/menaquinone biosynthesis C-methylase UbiE